MVTNFPPRENVPLRRRTADPGWLSSPVDLAVAVAGFRRVRQFFATSFMGQILDGEEIFPGANTTTDNEVREFVRRNSMTVWHASCSAFLSRSFTAHLSNG